MHTIKYAARTLTFETEPFSIRHTVGCQACNVPSTLSEKVLDRTAVHCGIV